MRVLVTYDISHRGLRRAVFNFLDDRFRYSQSRVWENFTYSPREVTAEHQQSRYYNQRSVIVYLFDHELSLTEFNHLNQQINAIIEHGEFTTDDKILCCEIGNISGYPYDILYNWE